MHYDPDTAPDPSRWLAASDGDRQDAVRQHHRREKFRGSRLEVHTAIHVAVENQLAEGHPAATTALERLLAEGLSRHDAIHAIGSVLTAEIYDVIKAKRPHEPEAYARKLGELTSAKFGVPVVTTDRMI